jgi:E3 ubiquitin ligase SMURF1/2/E3 ubiquitin-protein ligase NEDD4
LYAGVGNTRTVFTEAFRYQFVGEPAQDAGGPAREFFELVSDAIFDTELGLFNFSDIDTITYQINPASKVVAKCKPHTYLDLFQFVGRFLARALLESMLIKAALTRPLYKHLLGEPVTFSDLAMIDRRLADSLLAMSSTEGVEDWGITFSHTEETMPGVTTEVALITAACGWGEEMATPRTGSAAGFTLPASAPCPSGADTAVTDENKHQFIFLKLRYMLVLRAREQTEALLQGFYDVISARNLSGYRAQGYQAGAVWQILDSSELELLSCGLQSVDLADWRQHTSYSKQQPPSAQSICWFWEVVGAFNDEQRSKLLQWATGTSRVPVEGFTALQSNDGRRCPFMLRALPKGERYQMPIAHTCFNRIDLPIYKEKEMMRIHLMAMILEPTGFTQE